MFLPRAFLFIAFALGSHADWATIYRDGQMPDIYTSLSDDIRRVNIYGFVAMKLSSQGVAAFGHAYYTGFPTADNPTRHYKVCARFAYTNGFAQKECAGFHILQGLHRLVPPNPDLSYRYPSALVEVNYRRAALITVENENFYGWVDMHDLTVRGIDSKGKVYLLQGKADILNHCQFVMAL